MVRAPFIDKNGLKKGAWSKEEDDKLSAYIKRYGHWNWRELPKFAGLQRCGKSCRLRWVNYLKPNVKRGNYTTEEDDLIIKLHDELGNKWSKIAEKLPGRSDNEIKNHWHTNLKTCRGRRDNQNKPDKESTGTISSESESDNKKEESIEDETLELMSVNVNVESGNTKTTPASTASFDDHLQTSTQSPPGSEFSSSTVLSSGDNWVRDFWSEPFQVDFGTLSASPPSALVDDYHFFSPVAPALDDEYLWLIYSGMN